MFLFVLYTSMRRETFVSVVPNLDKMKKRNLLKEDSFLSLLSDSNQRPRDYKSRALAN